MEAPDHYGISRYEQGELGRWLGSIGLDSIDYDNAA